MPPLSSLLLEPGALLSLLLVSGSLRRPGLPGSLGLPWSRIWESHLRGDRGAELEGDDFSPLLLLLVRRRCRSRLTMAESKGMHEQIMAMLSSAMVQTI